VLPLVWRLVVRVVLGAVMGAHNNGTGTAAQAFSANRQAAVSSAAAWLPSHHHGSRTNRFLRAATLLKTVTLGGHRSLWPCGLVGGRGCGRHCCCRGG
jgi:hypothetical protein